MNATPMICPRCGELLIVRLSPTGRLFIPAHEDLIQPGTICALRHSAQQQWQSCVERHSPRLS